MYFFIILIQLSLIEHRNPPILMTKNHIKAYPERKSIRLSSFSYAQSGMYFITICTSHKECLFGRIIDGSMHLNDWGRIVDVEWQRTADIRRNIVPEDLVIMPNHVHAIIGIDNEHQQYAQNDLIRKPEGTEKNSLSSFVGGFKSAVTSAIHKRDGRDGSVWQRNYYEHIIRNEKELQALKEYMDQNPLKWELDKFYPDNVL